MNEFDIIQKYFRPLAQGRDDFRSDTAVLKIPGGMELVVTSDFAIAGTHFMVDAAPEKIATKALRRNLSDLAAAAARPFAYQLSIAFPQEPQESWLEAFTAALLEDQKHFGIFCSGGDTSSTRGPLSISMTALGLVPEGKAMRRSGAQAGDHIILTGPVGDALVGLRILQGKIKAPEDAGYFVNAYYRPPSRMDIGPLVRDYATAAIDISDGLVADLGHLCAASGVGAEIAFVPGLFSRQALKSGIPAAQLATGGDDYELILAVSSEKSDDFLDQLARRGLSPVKLGRFMSGQGVTIKDENHEPLRLESGGWRHF